MTELEEQQTALTMAALEAVCIQLAARGVPASVILASFSGFTAAEMAGVFGPKVAAERLRNAARQVEAIKPNAEDSIANMIPAGTA